MGSARRRLRPEPPSEVASMVLCFALEPGSGPGFALFKPLRKIVIHAMRFTTPDLSALKRSNSQAGRTDV
jgi:hypothetical protein